MAKQLPKSWLIHEIEYIPLIGKDENYDEPIYGEPTFVKNVRVDIDLSVMTGGNDISKSDNGVIFVDYVNSSPIPEFKLESKIIFKNKEYKLQRIVPCYQPNRNVIHHYELEVV